MPDSLGGSQLSLDGLNTRHARHQEMMSGVTTFHVGVVFFFIGLMLLISGLVPQHTNRQHQYWEDKSSPNNKEENTKSPLLLTTGSLLLLAGIVLTILNRVASRKEDEKFTRYISRKLAPTKIPHNASSNPLHQHRKPCGAINKEGHETTHERSLQSEICVDEEAQSPSQLEAIIEEAEDRMAKPDDLHWTSDLAPVHGGNNAKHHSCVLKHETENCNKQHRQHHHNHHHRGLSG